jgi:hypothetical protein
MIQYVWMFSPTGFATPIRNNNALQSSEAGSSETPHSLDTLSDVEKEAEKAKAKGISLADHMRAMSAKALEEHMQNLVKAQGDEDDKAEESEESEEDAEQSEDEMSRLESDEDDDKEAEHEEKVKALQIFGPCPEEKSEDESEESNDSSDSDSSSESESEDEATRGTGKEAEMQALVGVSQEAETTGKKGLANSTTNKADWDKFSRILQAMPGQKKILVELATHFLKDKVCLFNEWLSCGGDWSKVALVYKRKVADKRKFKKQKKGMKGRDIIAAYGETRPVFFLERSIYIDTDRA